MSVPRGPAPQPSQPHQLPGRPPGPSVPDPSMFFPQDTFPPPSANSSLAPCPRPPLPSSPSSLANFLQPQSDFSRLFHRTEATLFLQGSDTAQFSLLERHVQFNSSDIHQQASYKEQQGRISFPHPVQSFSSPRTRPSPASSSCPALAPPHGSEGVLAPPHGGGTTVPNDVVQMLAWQNSQLAKLQEQVTLLLAASPQSAPSTPPAPGATSASPQLRRQSSNSSTNTPTSAYNTPTGTKSVSTNTSSLWPDIQRGLARLREGESLYLEELHKSQVQVSQEGSSASSQPSLHLDLPEYQDSPEARSKQAPSMTSWSSPVLGESVSMYEEQQQEGEQEEQEEDVAELYHNILGQVKRLLAREEEPAPSPPLPPVYTPSPTYAPAPIPAPAPSLPPAPVDSRAATLDRLREMGVSFISPSDLAPAPAPAPSLPYNSVYLPRAALPSQSVFQGGSADTSLDISSLALKYLDDEQLSRLAVRHQGGQGGGPNGGQGGGPHGGQGGQGGGQGRKQVRWDGGTRDTGVTLHSATDLSLASHQFLQRHGLGEPGHPSPVPQPAVAQYSAQPYSPAQHPTPAQPYTHTNTAQPYRQNTAQPHTQNTAPPYVQQPTMQRTEARPRPVREVGPHYGTGGPRPVPDLSPRPPYGIGAPQPVPDFGPGPHYRMGAPQTLVDRVLDITAIQQQPKLL